MIGNRPFDELRATGLLWLINASVFHPRGYALAIHADGWSLLGDGGEVWQFGDDVPLDELLARVKEIMP